MSQSVERLDSNTLFKDGEIVVPDDVISEGIDPSKLPDNHFIAAGIWESQHRHLHEQMLSEETEEISAEEAAYLRAEAEYDKAYGSIEPNYSSHDLVVRELERRGIERPKPFESINETHTAEAMSAAAILAVRLQEKIDKASQILDPRQRQNEINRIMALERIRLDRKKDHAGPAKYGPVHH